MAEKNIPKPSSNVELAWTRAGVGNWSLVFDPTQNKWRVVKREDVTPYQITIDEYKGGQNTYSPVDRTAGGPVGTPADVTSRDAAASDPLASTVEKYGLQVVTDPSTGRTELKGFQIDPKTGKRGTVTVPYFLYLDSKNQIQVSSDYDAIKSKAIADLKATGQLNTLFQDLYNKKLISKEVYDAKDVSNGQFNSALLEVINEYSRSVITNREFGTSTQAPNFLGYLKGISGKGGGISEADMPRREFQDISKDQLNAFIDSIYLETIGRKPSEEQRKAKMKELDKIVKAGIVSTKKVVGGEIQYRTKGGFDKEQQALRLQEELKTQNPLEYERRQAFEFMDVLQKTMSGGM